MRKNTHVPEPEDNPGTKADLRLRAEKRLRDGAESRKNPEKPGEVQKLIHELQVHQIELEIQNEELVRVRDEVEAGLERYTELYDFSPVGYFTLDKNSTIRQANLTGATLFLKERSLLVGRKFHDFVSVNSRPVFNRFLRMVFGQPDTKTASIELSLNTDPVVVVQAEARVTGSGTECLLTVTDITGRKQAEEALRESEEKFRNVFDWANDAILLHTLTTDKEPGRFIGVNLVACRMLGYSQDELLIMGPSDIVPAELHPQLAEIVRQAQTKETFLFETRFRRKDGSIFPVESSGRFVNYQGKMIWISHIRDITERKRAEEALRESHARYKQLVENISDVIFTLDLQGFITYISPVIERLYGYPVTEVIGQHFSRFVHPDDLPTVIEGFNRRVKGNYGENVFRIIARDGRECYVRTTQTLDMKQGKLVGFNYTMTDFSDRRQVEDALRESEARFRNLFDGALDMIQIVRPDGSFMHVNPAWKKTLGYSDEDVSKLSVFDIIHPDAKTHCTAIFQDVISGNEARIIETQFLTSDGKTIPVEGNCSPELKDGAVATIRGIFHDITERKNAEEALRNFNKNLQQGMDERTAVLCETELKYRNLFESSRDSIMTLEPPDWYFTSCNPATVAMFRAKDETDFTTKAPWELSPEHQPDGRPSDEKAKEMIGTAMRDGSNYFEWTHRRFTGEDFPATVLLTRFAWKGKEILQANVRDITGQKQADDKIRASLEEKVILLREIHHRVKNNLQIIISLTNLQMRQVDDERLKQVMAETQNRVRAMSLVHEKLYQSEDISRIDLGSYTRFLVTHLFSYYGIDFRQVALHIDIGKIMLSINTAIPLGLIINELVSNALKHAFPHGRTGSLSIIVREEKTTLYLSVKDDGVGLAADSDWQHAESLGLRLVISLVEQLDGTIELDRSVGTAFVIVVKEKE